ncbi:MAG: hypothetical protein KDC80_21595 [Saprospiraceae bacterium]|nr:hypothetical protein [Saprospiraceae bacterium]
MAKRKSSQRKKTTTRKVRPKASNTPDVRDVSPFWKKDVGLSNREARWLKYITGGVTLIMISLSLRVGLNGDDDVQASYASSITSFYSSFGRDTSCFNSGPEIKYYGALFELITGTTNDLFGFEKEEPAYYQIRHIWSAIFGGVAIYFIALLIGEIAGFQASVLGIIMLFFSMRYLGHSLINPKDIPFAAGYTVSIYFLYQLLKSLPEVRRSTIAGMAAGIMMSVGIRIGGILVIGYLGLFVALYFIWKCGFTSIFRSESRPYYRAFFLPVILGMLGALLVWPFGLLNPLQNIPAALDAFANFQYAIKVLFDDRQVWSSDIPVEYLLTWMVLTIPIYTLIGALLFLGLLPGILRKFNFIAVFLCLFAFAFPIIYVLASGSILYDGWRHFLFTYPPLIVLVTLAWWTGYQRVKEKKILKYVYGAVLGFCILESAVFLFRNPSFPYVYFNPIAGGIKGAYGSYELDYWGTSVKQAVAALERQGILYEGMQDTVTIGTNFSHAVQVYTHKYNGLVKVNYVRWRQRNDRPWEYGIFVNRFVDGTYLRNGYWPTSKTINTIEVNGWPIAIIEKDALNSDSYIAAQAIVRQDWQEALFYAERETQAHPDNEIAWINLGMAYLNNNQEARAKGPLDQAVKIAPDNQNALNFLGYYFFVMNQLEDSWNTFMKAIELHQTDVTAYYYLARICYERQNYSMGLEYALTGIDYNTNNPLCYQVAAQLYYALGDQANAQRYLTAFNRLSGN